MKAQQQLGLTLIFTYTSVNLESLHDVSGVIPDLQLYNSDKKSGHMWQNIDVNILTLLSVGANSGPVQLCEGLVNNPQLLHLGLLLQSLLRQKSL